MCRKNSTVYQTQSSEYEVSLSCLQQSISKILTTAERIGKEIDVIEVSSSNLKMQESVEYIRVPSQKIDDIFQNLIEFEIYARTIDSLYP